MWRTIGRSRPCLGLSSRILGRLVPRVEGGKGSLGGLAEDHEIVTGLTCDLAYLRLNGGVPLRERFLRFIGGEEASLRHQRKGHPLFQFFHEDL